MQGSDGSRANVENDEGLEEMSMEQTEQRQVPSLRGAPAHMRSSIRRMQNVEVRFSFSAWMSPYYRPYSVWLSFQYARRSRERRKDELRDLIQKHNEQITQICKLELRVDALMKIILGNEIDFPENSARNVHELLQEGTADLSNCERLVDEFVRILEDRACNHPGPSSSWTEILAWD